MIETLMTGGCLCGAVRYAVRHVPTLVSYCHCPSCRRASGAPAMVWAEFPVASLEFTAGEPVRYASSPGVTRSFCSTCGSPLTHFSEDFPDDIFATVGSLDEPGALTPEMHVWTATRVAWFDTADRLPRHDKFRAMP